MMRVSAAIGIALLGANIGVLAQQNQSPRLAPAVRQPLTMKFVNAPVNDVFQFMSLVSGITIRFAPGVAEPVATAPKVSVMLNGASLEATLDFLMKAANLEYQVIDPKTVLVIRKIR